MFKRIIVATWLLGLLSAMGTDLLVDKKPDELVSYIVVSKAQDYSYHKSSSTQVNTLILKNIKTGELESKSVTVEAHFSSSVGETLQFKKDEIVLWRWFLYILASLCIGLLFCLFTALYALVYWIFTGREL